jgi:SAM-dependent methyltransferase
MTRSDARAFYTGRLQATYYDLGVARGGPTGSADVTFYADVIRPLGRRVLELGAGTGRVAIALAELGFEVTGLDTSGPMLDVARSKLADLAPEVQARVRLVHGDMATTRVGGGFDAVVIPARSFCFLLTPETQRACLALIREQLRPGGVLALQVFDP